MPQLFLKNDNLIDLPKDGVNVTVWQNKKGNYVVCIDLPEPESTDDHWRLWSACLAQVCLLMNIPMIHKDGGEFLPVNIEGFFSYQPMSVRRSEQFQKSLAGLRAMGAKDK
jgi:hypothetical protein